MNPPNESDNKVCDSCGNDYANAFQIIQGSRTYTFDCFECAIQLMAPRCAHCDTRIIGHGVEENGAMYCCNHCAFATAEAVHPRQGRKVSEQELTY